MLHGKRSVYAVDMVLEKIREYRDSLDMNKLIFFAKRDTLTVQRILGFVLDIFGIDTTELSHAVENKRGYSRMTCDQEHSYYNAKWHVYYHKHFKDTFQTT